jgi:hypothetical protein
MISEPTGKPLPLHVAIQTLSNAKRSVLADYAFGDSEVQWEMDERVIAGGHFSSKGSAVSFNDEIVKKLGYDSGNFSGDEAKQLEYLGTIIHSERNDMLGNNGYY